MEEYLFFHLAKLEILELLKIHSSSTVVSSKTGFCARRDQLSLRWKMS
ncbi:hypothetical protein SBF1_4990006 [Candidatus Desulfosporosinus infrequens]|uniref:Uncharacterized protein n=1 Tax=Candidatus Desulfosporosinus infrequens TaxID=2043169 RepID=A0A2U3LGZ6_9FIRM|nr:hypothetical protein SBF1_4990006 [Candidatus Desulfosporosinus infrequens]